MPQPCLELLARADLVLHVGDVTSAEALAELEAFGPLAGVHGNMDDRGVRARLPARLELDAEGLRIGLLHDAGPAAGRHERLLAAFPGCDLVAYGHTHVPEVARAGRTWIVNPGSPTERRRARVRALAVVEGGVPRLVELGA